MGGIQCGRSRDHAEPESRVTWYKDFGAELADYRDIDGDHLMAITYPANKAAPVTVSAKDPSAVISYGFDFTSWLGTETILTSVWTVPAGITKDSDSKTNTTTTIVLSGGTTGQTYVITNTITTASRTEERSMYVPVDNR